MRKKTTLRRSSKGFTLVEMIIVGALIALFSGLAIFGVQQQFRSNQRKAVIGETRQIATALDFAYNDVGFFPKLSLLDDSTANLLLTGQSAFGGNGRQIYAFMHALSIPTIDATERIEGGWLGPYFAASQSRSGFSQGKGGSRAILLADAAAGFAPIPPASDPDALRLNWPLDVYNNPYMVYMLNLDRNAPSDPELAFVTEALTGPSATAVSIAATGNFVNAVVSYGLNQVPGGGEFFRASGDLNNPNDNGPFGLRLYVGNPNDSGGTSMRLLQESEYTRRRANAWSRNFFVTATGGVNGLALSDDNSSAIGITDPGSDDVVFTF